MTREETLALLRRLELPHVAKLLAHRPQSALVRSEYDRELGRLGSWPARAGRG
jgi:hypothetical protein